MGGREMALAMRIDVRSTVAAYCDTSIQTTWAFVYHNSAMMTRLGSVASAQLLHAPRIRTHTITRTAVPCTLHAFFVLHLSSSH